MTATITTTTTTGKQHQRQPTTTPNQHNNNNNSNNNNNDNNNSCTNISQQREQQHPLPFLSRKLGLTATMDDLDFWWLVPSWPRKRRGTGKYRASFSDSSLAVLGVNRSELDALREDRTTALVVVRVCGRVRHSASQFCVEHVEQLQYLRDVVGFASEDDIGFACVQRLFRLPEPASLRSATPPPHTGFHTVTPWFLEEHAAWIGQCADELRASGLSGPCSARSWRPTVAVRVAAPFALLCTRGTWTNFAFDGRLGLRRFLPESVRRVLQAQATSGQAESTAEPALLTPEALRELAATLRRCARTPELEAVFERWVWWLEKLSAQLQNPGQGVQQGNRHWKYKADSIIRTVLLAEMSIASSIKEVVLHALSLACPAVADSIGTVLKEADARTLLSPASISRHRLTLHAGFLLVLREWNDSLFKSGATPMRVATCDASPQAGHEWLLCGSLTIPAASLLDSFNAAVALIDSKRVLAACLEDDSDEYLQAVESQARAALRPQHKVHQRRQNQQDNLNQEDTDTVTRSARTHAHTRTRASDTRSHVRTLLCFGFPSHLHGSHGCNPTRAC